MPIATPRIVNALHATLSGHLGIQLKCYAEQLVHEGDMSRVHKTKVMKFDLQEPQRQPCEGLS